MVEYCSNLGLFNNFSLSKLRLQLSMLLYFQAVVRILAGASIVTDVLLECELMGDVWKSQRPQVNGIFLCKLYVAACLVILVLYALCMQDFKIRRRLVFEHDGIHLRFYSRKGSKGMLLLIFLFSIALKKPLYLQKSN